MRLNVIDIRLNTIRMLKRIVFVLFVTAIVACGSTPRVDLEAHSVHVIPTAQHSVIAKDVVGLFENYSYKKVPLNDSISSIIYDNLLKSLDEGKNYLMKSDVERFEKYRYLIAGDFKKGDLSAAYHVYNTYIQRYLERMDFALSQIDAEHDFTIDETYVYNRKDLDWFATEEEANDQWRRRVKYDLLNLRLGSTNLTDSVQQKHKETLESRYTQLASQAKKTDNNEAFQIVMAALTGAIDPHTSYFNPYFAQQFNEGISNTFEGMGARLTMENEMVRVAEVIAGGPVFKTKALQIDDRIIGVAQGEEGEFEDIIGWRLDNTVAKIKGLKGTTVRLKVIPAGQELTSTPKIVTLIRDKVVMEETAKKETKTVIGDDGKTYKVGVIKIPSFYLDFKAYNAKDPNYKSTTRDVKLILDTLRNEKVDAVLVDLRMNGGGSLIEAIELTGLFIDQGPVVQVRDTRDRVDVSNDESPGMAWDGPLGVIVDRFSASASEIFAAAIQDYDRGIVLGTQTYGKGTVQSAIEMERLISPTNRLLLKATAEKDKSNDGVPIGAPEFGQINITIAKFYRINGSSTQHKEVMPDIIFPTMFSADKFGESSEPAALPWDQIESTTYAPVGNLTSLINTLEEKHEQRMETSPEYKYMLEDIELLKEREKETSVTLNAAKLKKEREAREAQNLDRINARRKLDGLEPLKKGDAIPKTDNDFIGDESLKVMADLIAMESK